MLSNITVPLLGLCDAAMIGHFAAPKDLAALALGTFIINFLFWSFGFLRMGTTSFVAQASGGQNLLALRTHSFRALALALLMGGVLFLLREPLVSFALAVTEGSAAVKESVRAYVSAALFGAPATLCLFALQGIWIGLQKTTTILWLHGLLGGLNLLFNGMFILGFGWGVEGVAYGTVLAQWLIGIGGVVILVKGFQSQGDDGGLIDWAHFFELIALKNTLQVNSDIFIRTLALMGAFYLFVNQGAEFGDTTLAANHLWLQWISLSAFFLDGFAYVLEAMAGEAMGRNDWKAIRTSFWATTRLAFAASCLIALLLYNFGPWSLALLTAHEPVQLMAREYIGYAAIYVVCSFLAFQMDGLFLGTGWSRPLMISAVLGLGVFYLALKLLSQWSGNEGLWGAFIAFVVFRGISLALVFRAKLTALPSRH